jgi:uncharacterized protein (UPF0212 family)
MDCKVVIEAAIPVYDVATEDEAIRIAIAKTGDLLNPDLSYVEINPGSRESSTGEDLPPVFVVADEALVALELEIDLFNVETEQHAERIALAELGQYLENIPLEILDVQVVEE